MSGNILRPVGAEPVFSLTMKTPVTLAKTLDEDWRWSAASFIDLSLFVRRRSGSRKEQDVKLYHS